MKALPSNIFFVVLLFLLSLSSVKADTQKELPDLATLNELFSSYSVYMDGVEAYNLGNYQTALRIFRPLAEEGYAPAQGRLGLMYANGRGVVQNYREAVRWYRLAAEQGDNLAQYNLGLMYANGGGVAQNFIQAHKWVNLSAANGGGRFAAEQRDILARVMTPAQIAEAQQLATEWMYQFNQRMR